MSRRINKIPTRNSGTVIHLSPVLLLYQVQVRIRGCLQNQVNFLPVFYTLADPVEVLQRFVPIQILLPACTRVKCYIF